MKRFLHGRALDHLIGAALCVGYVAVLFPTARDLAMSRDESFYVIAAEQYGAWLKELVEDPGKAVTKESIDRRWGTNHEHPPLIKMLFAVSLLAHKASGWCGTPGAAVRFPGMLLAGLNLWLIYIIGVRLFRRRVGLFAALAFALLPRIFYHSHLDCFDVPIVLMMTWVTFCYLRALECSRWLFWLGLSYGLALATKHNAWVLPGVFLIHWFWCLPAGRKLRLVPWWLIVMLTTSPALALGLWPWMWNDTLARLNGYAAFHVHHVYYHMAYFGRTYFEPPFPISYPFAMTLFTVPATVIALALVGLGLRSPQMLPLKWLRRFFPEASTPSAFRPDVLLVGCLLAPIVIIALPSTPIFGGTKHWFPAYPFLALYAGVGFSAVLDWLEPKVRERWQRLPSRAFAAITGALLLSPSLVETAHSHPFGLSHYVPIAGGVPGAADLGMNRQFWGFTSGSLAPWLREHLPNGGTVWICDTTGKAWDMMQADGMLPANIRDTGSLAAADFAIVHHEHHFVEVDFQIWDAFGSTAPVHVLTYDGVPIISVYENPRHKTPPPGRAAR